MEKKLSLKEESEKEANRIEEEILSNPELAGLEVSEQFDSEMASKIQEYENEKNKPGNP